MSFAEGINDGPKAKFKKNKFFFFTPGRHTVRLLDTFAPVFWLHWVRGTYFECLGQDNCPVCLNNRKIKLDNPDNFRKVPGYNSPNRNWYVNVLDRTESKVCPNEECGWEFKSNQFNKYPSKCENCDASLVKIEATPSNQVKILSRGSTLFDQFEGYAKSLLDDDGEKIPIDSYDFTLHISESAEGKRNYVATPTDNFDDVSDLYTEDDLFTLELAVLRLTPDEIRQVMRGVTLRDIFAARRADADAEASAEFIGEETDADLEAEVDEAIEELFPN